MLTSRLRIGTRGSDLALWQARRVAGLVSASDPNLEVEIVEISTRGDRVRDRPLPEMGSTGVFVAEVQERLLAGEVDLAVHSLKDLETADVEGLVLAAVPKRGPVRDVLVSRRFRSVEGLPRGARVGTGSPRRRAQLLALRPDLQVESIRGNVPTRVAKTWDGPLDGVILAEAGLMRLGMEDRIAERLSLEAMLPAPGQGALAIEVRAGDAPTLRVVARLDHQPTRAAVTAERALMRRLGGGCHAPIGAVAQVEGGRLMLRARVASGDGSEVLERRGEAPAGEARELGESVAEALLAAGAGRLIRAAER